MSEPVFGQLIKGEVQRDAIHIACVPVVAMETLVPGQFIVLCEDTKDQVKPALRDSLGMGIVDPFLTQKVYAGDRFWCWLKPGSVTGMRHHFNHPLFPDEFNTTNRIDSTKNTPTAISSEKQKIKDYSEKWLRNFCDSYDLDFEYVINEASTGGSICAGEEWDYDDDHDIDTFWTHLEVYLGRSFSHNERDTLQWRCAC